MQAVKDLWKRVTATPLWRAYQRYNDARGNLLAGGVSYFGFLSVFPALALAFTIFGLVLRGHPDLLASIEDSLSTALPGFIKTADNPDGIIAIAAPSAATLSVAGAISIGGLLYSGLGWMSALQSAVRGVLGAPGTPGNVITDYVRNTLVMIIFGLGIVISAGLTVVANGVARQVAELIGLGGQSWLLTGVGLLIGVCLDGALIALILRVLSAVPLTRRDLRNGALVGGIGLTVIKTLGTRLIASTTDNPLYASIALVVGLLVWINFMSRIVLLAAAIAGVDRPPLVGPDGAVLGVASTQSGDGDGSAASSTKRSAASRSGVTSQSGTVNAEAFHAEAAPTSRRERADAGLPTVAVRQADRANLAAGAVLGAVGAAGIGAAAKSVRKVLARR